LEIPFDIWSALAETGVWTTVGARRTCRTLSTVKL
jgi:hypothetical protein